MSMMDPKTVGELEEIARMAQKFSGLILKDREFDLKRLKSLHNISDDEAQVLIMMMESARSEARFKIIADRINEITARENRAREKMENESGS